MDWMHNFLVGGVANLEFHLFMQNARSELNVKYAQLHMFVAAAWRWPQWQSTHKACFLIWMEQATAHHARPYAVGFVLVFLPRLSLYCLPLDLALARHFPSLLAFPFSPLPFQTFTRLLTSPALTLFPSSIVLHATYTECQGVSPGWCAVRSANTSQMDR